MADSLRLRNDMMTTDLMMMVDMNLLALQLYFDCRVPHGTVSWLIILNQ